MRLIGEILAITGGLLFLIGGFSIQRMYFSRVGVAGFKLCKETLLWPFFLNKKEWAMLLGLAMLSVFLMYVGNRLHNS